MDNDIHAPESGTVSKIFINEGILLTHVIH